MAKLFVCLLPLFNLGHTRSGICVVSLPGFAVANELKAIIYIIIRDCTRVGAFPRAFAFLTRWHSLHLPFRSCTGPFISPDSNHSSRNSTSGEGRGGEGRGGEGRGGEGRGGEGRGLSTLSTNQNLCDRGA